MALSVCGRDGTYDSALTDTSSSDQKYCSWLLSVRKYQQALELIFATNQRPCVREELASVELASEVFVGRLK
jgi:hypothetical protein